MVTAARLPGIQFEVVAPPVDEALVRMDIAVFVGFAASGPVNLPVMVEDIAHFQEIFGEDLILATAADSKQPVYAYLPSAVRAFFRNGGRRCWVIRVADTKMAETGQFPLPGLFRLDSGGLTQAMAPARSAGRWSDTLVAGLSLESHAVLVTSFVASSTTVGLSLSAAGEVAPGDLLRFSFPGNNDVFWLFVDSVNAVGQSPILGLGGRPVLVSGSTSYWQNFSSPPAAGSLPACERITMDLRIQGDDGEVWNMTGLGLAPLHPRYWGLLPRDAALYAKTTPLTDLETEVSHPRFPLAGPPDGGFYLPLGVQTPASPPSEVQLAAGFFKMTGPSHSGATELERDGLAQFQSSLFLDGALAESDSFDILNEAFFIQYQSPTPRDLTGIHAALSVDEATMIAVPDAVHRGWIRVGDEALSSPPLSSPLAHRERWHLCGATVPPGEPQSGEFEPRDPSEIAAPVLTVSDSGDGPYSLIWAPIAGAVDYLEEAVDANFATAALKAVTASGIVTIYGQASGSYYYRVRRQVGAVSSDYSNGVAIRISVATGWQQNSVADYQDQTLLDVHRALVRMSAARGDLFALLGVPAHYRERETTSHAAQIKSMLASEPAAMSYGGIYHPWLTGREENDLSNLRTTPPDGAMAGIMAKRSTNRGAWISPANEKLTGVVALSPPILRTYLQLFQDSQVNLIRQEPAGFLCLSEMTLTDDDDLLPINVRRLLSFLRKTALREGNQYVFEPMSDAFERSVESGFVELLSGLARRGAFAGASDKESFQVVTDSSLNTPAAADLGRFYVELRVAPSVPMRFLTVRLLQTADRTFVTEGQ
ncbi:MAG TPA: phage tail sheath C-terminal domain-containing protein [Bryobacteraceae bacterium]|nr:phage tail sheath C-terminal domain-containing protein [Bryobacteraceae bacterium]